jgi:hypothetical protein
VARLHHVHRAHQVDLHHAAEGIGGHAVEARREIPRRARDQHVEIAPCAVHLRKPRLDRRHLAHVGRSPIASAPSAFSAATVSSTLSCDRLATATRAPWRANSSAMPRLMPLVPPTTTTVLPLKSRVMLMTLVLPQACPRCRHVRPRGLRGHGKDMGPTPRYFAARGMQDSKLTPPWAGAPSPPARREDAACAGGGAWARGEQISHWDRSAAEPDVDAPLDGDATADVAIVGGGFTGLSTALHGADGASTASCWRPSASAMAGRAGTWAS